jgi:hypothetical protein
MDYAKILSDGRKANLSHIQGSAFSLHATAAVPQPL